MTLAPIVLFVYNRPWHTRQTIEALRKNEFANESDLYIYSDASKNEKSNQLVEDVRKYIKSVDGFKSITIIEQDKNLGLAESIIAGVSKIINEYGKIIVLEDDLITSPLFLRFMNETLNLYKHEKRIWHISGWNYPIEFITSDDVYLYRVMDCWGWATWSDRWEYFEKNTDKLLTEFSRQDIIKFNLDGATNLWQQLKLNKHGRIDTWAIYWYATIFKHDGLCLNPVKSFIRNIGHDGTGVHCSISSYADNIDLNNNKDLCLTVKILEENIDIVEQIKLYFKKTNKNLLIKIFNKTKTKLKKMNAFEI